MEETRTTPAAESNGVEIRSENVTARVLQLQAEEMEAQRIFSELKARAARAQVQVQMHSHSQPKAEADTDAYAYAYADAYVDAYADAPQESSRYQILQSRVNRKLKPQRSNTRRRPSGGSVISRADSTNSRSSASTSKTYRRYSRREKGKGADHDDDHEDGHGHGQEQRSRRFCDSGCLPSCLPTVGLGVGACLQSVVLCNQLGGYSYGGLGYGYGYGYGLGSYYGYGYGYPSSCTPALPVATVPYGTCLY